MQEIKTVALVGGLAVVPVEIVAFHDNGMATVFYPSTGGYDLKGLADLAQAGSAAATNLGRKAKSLKAFDEAQDVKAHTGYVAAYEAVAS